MISENYDAYLADHGGPCLVGAVPFAGILDAPAELIKLGHGDVNSNMYALLVKSSVVTDNAIKRGTPLKVTEANGNLSDFVVRDVLPIDDGAFSNITLSKS